MKKDAAPPALRRPFIRLAGAFKIPNLEDMLRRKEPAASIVKRLLVFHPKDPQYYWKTFLLELRAAYAHILHEAGKTAFTRKADRSGEITVPLNKYAKAWIDKRAGKLCTDISQQQHEIVKLLIAEGYAKGARPEEIANHIRASVGLTMRQAAGVENLREKEGDDAADRYAERQLSYRAEVIARTENRTAVEEGRRSEWLQARDDGEIPETAKRVWVSAPASFRLCPICEDLDGQEADLDGQFHHPDADPPDFDGPTAHPGCRCTVTLDV